MKNPNPHYIKESGKFRQLSALEYDHIVDFVFRNIRLKVFPSYFYFGFNLICLLTLLYFFISPLAGGNSGFFPLFLSLVGGLLSGSVLIIPLHEIVHGLAYKIVGAPRIHFGADLRQMIFYVTAHNFAINRKSFRFVAMAPFVFINLSGGLVYFLTYWTEPVFLLSLLFFHNLMCIGDFAMLSYFSAAGNRELYTFDDLDKRVSYIYEKI